MRPDPILFTTFDDLVIHDILTATMPDGSPIGATVKVDTILAHLHLDSVPNGVRRLMVQGVRRRRPSRIVTSGEGRG